MIKATKVNNGGSNSGSTAPKYVGFANVEVRAINPTRSELNKLLGKDGSDDDKEIEYLSQDGEGKNRLRMVVWLYNALNNKYFPYSFFLSDKERVSKDGVKNQFVNATGGTAWADEAKNLQEWFTSFTDKNRNVIAEKKVRKALVGEEELTTLMRSWLGRMTWNDPDTEVLVDMKALFNEDYSELRDMIDGPFDAPFVALLGVRVDENDPTKEYQQVYGKGFLPNGFLNYITKGVMPTEYASKAWNRFVTEVEGAYGFTSYFELVPLVEYDKEKNVAASPSTMGVTSSNSKY